MGKEKKVNLKDVKKYSNSSVSDATLKRLNSNKTKTDKPKLFSLENVKAKDVLDVGIKGLEVAKGKSMEALPDSGKVRDPETTPLVRFDDEYAKTAAKIDKLYPYG